VAGFEPASADKIIQLFAYLRELGFPRVALPFWLLAKGINFLDPSLIAQDDKKFIPSAIPD